MRVASPHEHGGWCNNVLELSLRLGDLSVTKSTRGFTHKLPHVG